MKKYLNLLLLLFPQFLFAWGSDGHKMVASVARDQLDSATRALVQQYLGKMSFEDAATWMDDVRDDKSYDYMKPWHFVNIDSGGTYRKSPKGDAVSVLDSIIRELKNYKKMKPADVQRDLKILFHLCGDIVQPLHVGYGKDLGGNSVDVHYGMFRKSNLHKVWDSEIIRSENISKKDCEAAAKKWTEEQKKKILSTKPMDWMNDSRKLLSKVYNFKGNKIDKKYIDANGVVIEDQVAKGGYRLAKVLTEIFGT